MELTTRNTAVVLDSTADLPDASERHPNWRTVPLYVRFGEEVFRDYVDLEPRDFYRRLRATSQQPRSSQPAPGDFTACFERLSEYEQILVVCISEKLSGTHESATLAAADAEPGRVLVLDSRTVSGGIGLLAEALQRRLERGTTEEELLETTRRYREQAGFAVALETLEYLARGGRVGRAAVLASQLASVKPVLRVEDGEVAPAARVRGRARSLAELERIFVAETEGARNVHAALMHADSDDDAEQLAARVRAARPDASLDFELMFGPVLGTNAGPGAIALAWFSDAE
jgi:DegV family protein with EDD domain